MARFWRTDTATPAATQGRRARPLPPRQRPALPLLRRHHRQAHLLPVRRAAERFRHRPAVSGTSGNPGPAAKPQLRQSQNQRRWARHAVIKHAQAQSLLTATAILAGCNQASQVVRPAGPVRSPHHSMALPPQPSRSQQRPESLLGSPAPRAVRPVGPAVPRRPERSSAPGWFESFQRPLATQPAR